MSAAATGGGGGTTTTTAPPPSGGATSGSQESIAHKMHLPWWPEGDTGKLREAARGYRAAAAALANAGETGQRGISDVTGSNTGGAITAMGAKWSGTYYGRSCLSGPSAGAPAIDNAIATCNLLAQGCEDYAQHIDDAKHRLEELAAELVAGLVVGGLLTFVTAGLSDAAAAANAARVVTAALELADTVGSFVAVAFRVGGLAIQGALVGAGSDLAMQDVRMIANPQASFSFAELGESAGFGAILNPALAGGGAALGRGLSSASRGLSNVGRELGGTMSDAGAGVRAFGRGFPELLPKPGLVTPEGVVVGGGPGRTLKDLLMEARAEASSARSARTGLGAVPDHPVTPPGGLPYDRAVAEQVPPYGQSGPKTSGILQKGEQTEALKSGRDAVVQALPKPRPGMNGNLMHHVEAQAAARLQAAEHGVLYLNRIPCSANGGLGCLTELPKMLRPGAELTVYWPGGSQTFVGLPR